MQTDLELEDSFSHGSFVVMHMSYEIKKIIGSRSPILRFQFFTVIQSGNTLFIKPLTKTRLGSYSAKIHYTASILYESIAGRYRPVRVHVADGPITLRYRFIKNVYWVERFRR